ncbi:hypothetical protein Goshw_005927 [Gossypium schwendimanii]|uniref:Small ribosomal subunit protein eS4 N-terminal domain-containing protein n=1 Tax=Gossypium schwendimanii TaxID=34291 RepID=A0A7J9KQT3_GOSSC|nr:hypothetical protein [Gossypium schwendimanii]
MLDKLGGAFAPKPSSGPHKSRECLPLILILRNRLKYALTYREVIAILMQRHVMVDGKVRTDKTYPAGFMGMFTFLECFFKFRLFSLCVFKINLFNSYVILSFSQMLFRFLKQTRTSVFFTTLKDVSVSMLSLAMKPSLSFARFDPSNLARRAFHT